ncbi:MAG TPA: aspartyl protease family protein [Candidatus Acidoferrales bacterium]|nr:aspartyl protease family protein [Candidatus Acidoferrales bacterium]
MRDAAGGAAWNRVAETAAFGTAKMAGLAGTAVIADDRLGGRYARRFRVAVMGSSADVFDGTTLWAQDISGGVHALDAPFARRRAVTDAALASRTYLASGSHVDATCAGTATQDGRTVLRVRIRPNGGIPAVLLVDAQTHLLDAVQERLPTTTEVTRYADYRDVDGLALPFSIESGTRSEPADGYAVRVRGYRVSRSANASDFRRPAALAPARMLDGATSTTVPIVVEGRQLLVWASIDGHPPMPFILDTGGHAIVTPQAARALGLHASGAGQSGGSGAGTIGLQYAPVDSLRIGEAELRRQTFLVIPYSYSFYERGARQPLAGILGLEIFERFATRIDYGRGRLTLTPFSAYRPAAGAAAVPICFQEDMPLGHAAADGHAALFGIDTGNAGSVILFGTFLKRTGLLAAYPNGSAAVGHGTGGSDAGRIVALRRLSFAGATYARVPAFLTDMRSGSFSSWTEAGNFGYEILSRAVPTFDYAAGTLYVQPSPFAQAPPKNRAGLIADKTVPQTFEVERVAPGSPAAAAGIVSGDTIVAVDGTSAQRLSYGDLYRLVTAAAGTALRLRVVHAGTARDVTLILR